MNLEQLRILVKVVQAGSFTSAADRLGVQKSHVSRVVAQLEAELGVKLLERTTRTLSVTEVGREVFERAVGILGAVDDTVRLAQSTQGEPRGLLRVTCGVEFGLLAVDGWIEAFLARYPLTTADVDHTSRVIDIVHEGFDVAIRIGPLQESRLIARLLGHIEYGLFASPRYLAANRPPADPRHLARHHLVMFTGGGMKKGWKLLHANERDREGLRVDGPARLRVNNSFSVREALLHDLGIGQLPLLVAVPAIAAGRLVRVLEDWSPAPVPVHAVYASTRYLSPNVRAFIDLAGERFPRETALAREGKSLAAPRGPPAT